MTDGKLPVQAQARRTGRGLRLIPRFVVDPRLHFLWHLHSELPRMELHVQSKLIALFVTVELSCDQPWDA